MKAFEFKPKLFTTLQNYSKESFMADLMAGIIVGIVAPFHWLSHLVSLREFPQKKASSLLL